MTYFSAALAAVLAAVHVMGPRLRAFDVVPRSVWLSMAGGVSVAYVFVHILPDLSRHQRTVTAARVLRPLPSEVHVYLVALIGLVIFYALERSAKLSRRVSREQGLGDQTTTGVFWLHMTSFAVYNALIGYLMLHRETPGRLSLILFTVAMALHFVVTDFGLWQDHKEPFLLWGRWILMASIAAGWGIGASIRVHPLVIAFLFAFLAGGVLLNVLKEELPEERQSRFWAFALGATAYTLLLLLA